MAQYDLRMLMTLFFTEFWRIQTMIFVKDAEKTAKETSAEFWRKIEGNTLQNDLTSLIELKQHYIEEHSNPQDAMVALHKNELEKLEILSSAKGFCTVGGNSWSRLSKILDSYDGCHMINEFFAQFVDFPTGSINNLIFFVDPEAAKINIQSYDGNNFVVLPCAE